MSLSALLVAGLAGVASPGLAPCGNAEIGRADCTTVAVPLIAGSSQTLNLDVIILRSTGQAATDALVVLQGGPGQAATPQADFYARTFAKVRQRRDIYLIDVRGTGAADSLHCPVSVTARQADMIPIADVRACREAQSERRLESYSTRQIVADLEAVRSHFGLDRVNLYGTSYGSRLALEYMRLHPRVVRSAILSGVLPAQADPPTDYGRFAQRTFQAYAASCAETAACAQQFPDPLSDLERSRVAVLRAWQAGTGSVSPGLFGELVRMELYGPGRIPGLFRALGQAAAGDLSFWEARAQRLLGVWSPQGLSLGMFLSVTCGDFMPAVDRARVERSSAGSFAGTYRFDQQAAACAEWPVRAAPADFFEPVRADVPTLLVSGAYDPVTPPEWGNMAAATLSRSRAVTIANNGHALGQAASCVGDMAETLIETLDPARIDVSCADDLPPPFVSGD